MSRPPPLPPPFLRAVEVDTEPGLGAMALKTEIARLLTENGRLRSERNDARLERDGLRAELVSPDSLPPPTPRQRRHKVMVVGAAAGVGGGVLVLARLVLRFVADQWPEYAPLVDGLLGILGGL